MTRYYIRTCQECDYVLKASGEPKDKSTNSFRNRKCPKCKSEAFDYGKWWDDSPKPDSAEAFDPEFDLD